MAEARRDPEFKSYVMLSARCEYEPLRLILAPTAPASLRLKWSVPECPSRVLDILIDI